MPGLNPNVNRQTDVDLNVEIITSWIEESILFSDFILLFYFSLQITPRVYIRLCNFSTISCRHRCFLGHNLTVMTNAYVHENCTWDECIPCIQPGRRETRATHTSSLNSVLWCLYRVVAIVDTRFYSLFINNNKYEQEFSNTVGRWIHRYTLTLVDRHIKYMLSTYYTLIDWHDRVSEPSCVI